MEWLYLLQLLGLQVKSCHGWEISQPSTARISGLEIPQTSGFCFQVSRTGSVAPPVELGWEVVKQWHHKVPARLLGWAIGQHLASCWRSDQLAWFSPYSCSPANSGWAVQHSLGVFFGVALIKHLHKTSAVSNLLLSQVS